ncbi:glycosyl transferase family 4 [Candidatus Pacearchaeota archaeon]|nr:glycosyl transferase family 4 [Candidatus Pacearchaeota archaeon]
MASGILLIPILASFFITLFLLPFWMKKARQIGLLWDDMNKIKAEKVAGSGGIMVLLGFIVGVLLLVAYRVFYLHTTDYLIEILATLLVVTLAGGIGLVDDLLGWVHGGLSIKSRIFLVIIAAIPLMVINAGRSLILFPFLGQVDLGFFYPLVLIPLGIVAATTTFNMIAGHNGLEAGQGTLILIALGLVAYLTGQSWLSVLALCMVVALIAFLYYNFYPAKVFPGDVLTYSVGALCAILSILGNFEKIAVFFFIPYILEVILKSRGKLIKQSFGKPQKDGTLALPYDKLYGLEHVAIALLQKSSIKPTEKRVVYTLWIFQIIIILLGFVIFRQGIFYG